MFFVKRRLVEEKIFVSSCEIQDMSCPGRKSKPIEKCSGKELEMLFEEQNKQLKTCVSWLL